MNFIELFDDGPARVASRYAGLHRNELPLNLQVMGFRVDQTIAVEQRPA